MSLSEALLEIAKGYETLAKGFKMAAHSEKAIKFGTTEKAVRKPKEKKDPDAPKRPPSAYLAYLADYRKTDEYKAIQGDNSEKMKVVAEIWKNLPKEDKDTYTEKAKIDFDAYKDKSTVYKSEHNEDGTAHAPSSSSSSSAPKAAAAPAAAPPAAKKPATVSTKAALSTASKIVPHSKTEDNEDDDDDEEDDDDDDDDDDDEEDETAPVAPKPAPKSAPPAAQPQAQMSVQEKAKLAMASKLNKAVVPAPAPAPVVEQQKKEKKRKTTE